MINNLSLKASCFVIITAEMQKISQFHLFSSKYLLLCSKEKKKKFYRPEYTQVSYFAVESSHLH